MNFPDLLKPREVNSLVTLLNFDKEVILSIVDDIRNHHPTPVSRDVVRKILIKNIGNEDLSEKILVFLLSVYNNIGNRQLSALDLYNDFEKYIKHAIDINQKENENAKSLINDASFEDIFKSIFELENLWTISKATGLSYEYKNLFQKARIVTDIRPVFDAAAESIKGSIVTHILRIYYINEYETTSISLALDQLDILKLRDSCERALKKSRIACEFMNSNNIESIVCGTDDYPIENYTSKGEGNAC